MRRLHERYWDELVVIGVHSPKFPHERETANVREAVRRHAVRAPVVNDTAMEMWKLYGVSAWPTIALVDPRGSYLGSYPGEVDVRELSAVLDLLIADFDAQGAIDRTPLGIAPESAADGSPLLYPSKLLPGEDGRLFVADTGHHRVLETRVSPDGASARVVRAFGSGRADLVDGPASESAFHCPRGLAANGSTLYVADTGNHAVRAIDLASGSVRTVAGTGELGRTCALPKTGPTETPLRSPWALLFVEEILFIAMAGSHQLWVLVADKDIGVFAGNGREALVDGPRAEASFNQPSDLAIGMGHLFVADPEASAVRAVSLDANPQVLSLVGRGLFEFGDVDGQGNEVRLQHPGGVAFQEGKVYIADSYNHKVKRLDPTTGHVQTVLGTGRPGHSDGPFERAELWEPDGLAIAGGRVYLADTNNHAIRVADLAARTVSTLALV
ncbi:MAG: alkyl hydroperoxide reductase [Planctomycetes bacterium]|nr:alkyl hydroperoxide reductase [Planctomycetota bacterium]